MKRKNIAMALLAAVVAIGTASYAAEKQAAPEQAQGKKQTHCPVMNKNPINKKMYTDVKGYRIYVCCPGCIGKIKADPDKYIKQMEAKGIAIEKSPKKEDAKKAESKEDK